MRFGYMSCWPLWFVARTVKDVRGFLKLRDLDELKRAFEQIGPANRQATHRILDSILSSAGRFHSKCPCLSSKRRSTGGGGRDQL